MRLLKNHKPHKANNYKVSAYTKRKALELGLVAVPSSRKGKKVDFYHKRTGQYKGTSGALGYNDYTTYLEKEKAGLVPKGTAKRKQESYHARHNCRSALKGTNKFYSCFLLW